MLRLNFSVFMKNPMANSECRNLWVVRTSFSTSHDQAWGLLKTLIEAPQHDSLSGMDFVANVQFVEDTVYADLSSLELVRALPDGYQGFVVFVADAQTMNSKEYPLLVVGFSPQGDTPEDFERKPNQTPGEDIRSFRAIPSTIQSIENNLSIANMDFEDFRTAVGKDGIFRGFTS